MKNYFLSFFRTLPVDGNNVLPLTFTANQTNSTVTLSVSRNSVVTGTDIEFRTNINQQWDKYQLGTKISLNNVNDWVQFKNNTNTLSINQNNFLRFEMTGKIKGSGDIQSLLNYSTECPAFCFKSLFSGCNSLISAPKLTATNIGEKSYEQMFYNCGGLKVTPELTAPIVASRGYSGMFNKCKNLLTVSKITAEQMGDYCCGSMFAECDNLINVPDLNFPSYSRGVCQTMFQKCINLVNPPKIVVNELGGEYCQYMFDGCIKLARSATMEINKIAGTCFMNMYRGCTSLTEPPTLPYLTLFKQCYDGMFKNCINLLIAPKLPASTLAELCYQSMFEGCTSLIEGPDIHDVTLAKRCFERMFANCTNLSYIKVDIPSWQSEGLDVTTDWMLNVAENGIFIATIGLTDERGTNRIPTGWTLERMKYGSLTFIAEEANSEISLIKTGNPTIDGIQYREGTSGRWNNFSITSKITLKNVGDKVQFRNTNNTLSIGQFDFVKFKMTGKIAANGDVQSMINYNTDCTDYCFTSLFDRCTQLTEAPVLPAIKLGKHCYDAMFYECIQLVNPPVLNAVELNEGCYYSMFEGCISLTTAPELPATELKIDCYNSMFGSCSSLTTAPELLATKLVKGCYDYMFSWCENISNIKVNFTSWTDDNGESCTTDWTYGVKNTGTFTCPLPLPIERGEHRIPNGWDVNNA